MTKPYAEQDVARLRLEREAAQAEAAELRAKNDELRGWINEDAIAYALQLDTARDACHDPARCFGGTS